MVAQKAKNSTLQQNKSEADVIYQKLCVIKFLFFDVSVNKWCKTRFKSFLFLRRPQNLTKSSPSIWHLLHSVKSTVKILPIFVSFLENMNFKRILERCGIQTSSLFVKIWLVCIDEFKANFYFFGIYMAWFFIWIHWSLLDHDLMASICE